jgi:hypothetical protein
VRAREIVDATGKDRTIRADSSKGPRAPRAGRDARPERRLHEPRGQRQHVAEADAVSTAHHESATQAVAVLGCQREAVGSGAMVGGGGTG